jgi:hypothetical protein
MPRLAVSRLTNPPIAELAEYPQFVRWLVRVFESELALTRTYTQSINPASVSANSESTQTFTVTGLVTDDLVIVNKPTDTANLYIRQAWVSAANTLSLKFYNDSGGAIDAGAETYKIVAIRT